MRTCVVPNKFPRVLVIVCHTALSAIEHRKKQLASACAAWVVETLMLHDNMQGELTLWRDIV